MTGPRAVLVTGAAQRLGAAQAETLARAGWRVAIHYHTSERLAWALAQRLSAECGVRCVTVQADLQDPHATAALIGAAEDLLGCPLTGLVNNASVFPYDEAQTFTVEQLDRVLRVNLTAPVLLARTLAMAWPQGPACVVNILDQKVDNLNPDFFSYTLSKQALAAATRLLARALAPVRVCGVAPGLSLPSADQNAAEFAAAHRITPLGGSSTPADIAAAVRFLLEAPAVTGQILTVDGGQHMLKLDRDVLFVQRARDADGG